MLLPWKVKHHKSTILRTNLQNQGHYEAEAFTQNKPQNMYIGTRTLTICFYATLLMPRGLHLIMSV